MSVQQINSLGKAVSAKIPKYLYHITTKKNYRAIMKGGLLRTSNDSRFGQGIFTFDLKNFFENWKDVVYDKTGENYVELLLNHVSKKKNKIVMFRIPTSKLNMDKLSIRSQNRLHKLCYTDFFYDEAEPEAKMLANLFQRGEQGEERALYKKFVKEISKDHNIPDVEHCIQGSPVAEIKQYEHEAIEYIYGDNIPVSDIEKVGEVNQLWCMLSRKYDDSKPIKSIFDFMFRKTPEAETTKWLEF